MGLLTSNSGNEIIFSTRALSISVSKEASRDAVNLLKKTTYGTNGPKYIHSGQEMKVKHVTGPYFFDLYDDQTLIGTYCLSQRIVKAPAGNVMSFYGRYLAIDPAYGGRGYGRILKTEAINYIDRLFKSPYLFYSYIEDSNGRSLNISAKEKFKSFGKLEALLFSRLYPKNNPKVSRLAKSELPKMLALLENAYQDYTLVQFDQVYYGQNYFVIKDEHGEIVVGVQANPTKWKIIDMPGMMGKFVMNIVPHIPILKRLVIPNNYQFVALEAIYLKNGSENELFDLLEGVLSHFKFTSALIMQDTNSPISRLLKESGRLGMMNSLKKSIYSLVMVRSQGLEEDQIKKSIDQPFYTSSFDYT